MHQRREPQTSRAPGYEQLLENKMAIDDQNASPIDEQMINAPPKQFPEMVKKNIPQGYEEQQSNIDEPVVRSNVYVQNEVEDPFACVEDFDMGTKLNDLCKVIKSNYELLFFQMPTKTKINRQKSGVDSSVEQERVGPQKRGRKAQR